MYSASPEKRKIIQNQIEKWFNQGVIEESKSPWSAPVVIAYWNNKPRFCVDYRKLNAETVPDEFPIPRQTEILASLSRSIVMSSLDALAGFNQMEMDLEHRGTDSFPNSLGVISIPKNALWTTKWALYFSMSNAIHPGTISLDFLPRLHR